jgi:CDP-glycerol glycerophosphotransferase
MKDLGPAIVWGLNRIGKVFGNIFSFIIRCFTRVHKGRMMCWAYTFKQYSCNPRYLTEHLLENNTEFEIFWVFRGNVDTSGVDKRIKCVRYKSLQYYILVNTAEFFITNARTDPYRIYWHKRKGQKYVMLWHGGVALKRIEKDAEAQLSYSYLKKAKIDSKVCDLMVSGCRFQTSLLKEKFWYDGEILERGIPRNDVFFDKARHPEMKERICHKYGISPDSRIVLYAPTFRRDKSIEPYRIDWSRVVPELRKIYGTEKISILLRLHPNLIGKADASSLINDESVIDVTRYHDMQELLCVSDLLITDYSSSMFDITMLKKPCMLYATDIEKYNRGYYFDFAELPFPLARNEEELIGNIRTFDSAAYDESVESFFEKHIGLCEDGNASKAIAGWLTRHI